MTNLHFGSPHVDEPLDAKTVHISREQRGGEFKQVAIVVTMLDVISAAASQIGKPGSTPTLARSVSSLAGAAMEILGVVRDRMADQARDPDADEAVRQAAEVGSRLSYWNES